MRVYKYMSLENFKKTVIGGRLFLKASRPSEFNDPYEGKGVIEGEPSIGFAREWLDEFSLWDIVNESDSADRESLIKIVCRANMKGQFDWFGFFDDMLRVVCFSDPKVLSQTGSDLLMWSHYADSGRGVRLEIELEDQQFPVKQVRYRDLRPRLDLGHVEHCDASRDKSFAEYLCDCVLTKPKVWHYEQERRLVLFLSQGLEQLRYVSPLEQYKPLSKRDYVLEIPGECLKEITLGPKVDHVGDAQERMKAIRNDGFANVSFKRAMFGDEYAYWYVNLFNE